MDCLHWFEAVNCFLCELEWMTILREKISVISMFGLQCYLQKSLLRLRGEFGEICKRISYSRRKKARIIAIVGPIIISAHQHEKLAWKDLHTFATTKLLSRQVFPFKNRMQYSKEQLKLPDSEQKKNKELPLLEVRLHLLTLHFGHPRFRDDWNCPCKTIGANLNHCLFYIYTDRHVFKRIHFKRFCQWSQKRVSSGFTWRGRTWRSLWWDFACMQI